MCVNKSLIIIIVLFSSTQCISFTKESIYILLFSSTQCIYHIKDCINLVKWVCLHCTIVLNHANFAF